MRLALLSLVALACTAQQAGTPSAAERVVKDALEALGGERFLAMADRVEEGRSYSFYHERLSGLAQVKYYTRYLTRPEPMTPEFFGLRERRAMGKKEETYVVYNETGGYEITYRGIKPLAADVVASYRETVLHNVLYILRMRLGEPGLVFDSGGADRVENMPCDIIDITDTANRTTRVWFHQSTHLPLRQSWSRRDEKTRERIEEVTVFDKYRDIGGGVKWPFVVRRERNGQRIYEMYDESVALNRGLTDDLFTITAGMKVVEPGSSSNIRPGSARKEKDKDKAKK